MAFWDSVFGSKKEVVQESAYISSKYLNGAASDDSEDILPKKTVKAKTPGSSNLFSYGEKVPHPFNDKLLENAYNDVPLLQAQVDATTDLAVGPGVYVDSGNEDLDEFCTNWMHDVDFDLTLRPMFANSLIYGFSSAEILWDKQNKTIQSFQLQDPKTMFKLRAKGELATKGYFYEDGLFKKQGFGLNEIWWNDFNVRGTNAYGTSLFKSMIGNKKSSMLTNKLMVEDNMAILMKRKANAPIHVKVGSVDKAPAQSDIDAITAGFEVMGPKTEWITGPFFEINALDIGGKIINPSPFLDHFERQIKFAGGLPDVYLGYGNIAEGLAKEQGEVVAMRLRGLRSQIERGIEQQLLLPLAVMNGFSDFPDLKWGVATPEQEREKLEMYTRLLSPQAQIDPYTKLELVKQVRSIMGIEEPLPADTIDFLKPQPQINPFGNSNPEPTPSENYFPIIGEGYDYQCVTPELAEKFSVVDFMKEFLKSFKLDLEGLSKAEMLIAKDILIQGLEKHTSIPEIAKVLANKLYGGDKAKGELVARTELIRAENEGALASYKKSGLVEEVEWLVHEDERTCEICAPHNGERYSFFQAQGVLPGKTHPRCRCRWLPIVKEEN